jgi:hypothetical protein
LYVELFEYIGKPHLTLFNETRYDIDTLVGKYRDLEDERIESEPVVERAYTLAT